MSWKSKNAPFVAIFSFLMMAHQMIIVHLMSGPALTVSRNLMNNSQLIKAENLISTRKPLTHLCELVAFYLRFMGLNHGMEAI
jgi:hypothetical protein